MFWFYGSYFVIFNCLILNKISFLVMTFPNIVKQEACTGQTLSLKFSFKSRTKRLHRGLSSSSQAKPGLFSILSRLGHNLHTKYQGVKYYAGCQHRYTYPRVGVMYVPNPKTLCYCSLPRDGLLPDASALEFRF